MKILAIIPARFASTRFPGKPLIDIWGKPMIQRVYEQAKKSNLLHQVVVATDHTTIYETVKNFGGKVFMTKPTHQNGTERCAEVAEALQQEKYDIIINIQGDEPFFEPEAIQQIAHCFQNPATDIATLVKPIENPKDIDNPSVIKAVIAQNQKALYFSRQAIPFYRQKPAKPLYYKHIGIYAYRPKVLQQIVQLHASPLEQAESLEQLRWLENGFNIYTNTTSHDSNSVDTPEDLSQLLQQFTPNYFTPKPTQK